MPKSRTVVQAVTIAAPAATVYDLISDVERWPQFHPPAVHAEYLERGEGADLVQQWTLDGLSAVRTRRTRRTLDRSGLRITFDHEDPRPPAEQVSGGWFLEESAAERTTVEMRHELTVTGEAAELVAAVEKGTAAYLATLKDAAERVKELEQLVISFEDPLFIAGRIEDVYRVLYEADKWPERMAHVKRLDMTEDEPNVQFFDMDTHTPDGVPHTTRSVRLCFPHHRIVYKQIRLPGLLDAHLGHWKFTETPEGVIASARHAATIKPSALSLLGEGTTVPDARRYLRRVLSTNSLSNLHIAKRYAEERANG
ncbi:aromatase/cyclase [Crossiella sp. CA-258035]|uniref:aromatase/cyclase n=1 Tax=Crossiella sp. CA-258035 TaxID=2981138 RepID=UPI0024BCBFEC|nr:aromatase/cyclase [Crossiella sp. CA-258035]WHT23333.1 aromatase/cyclase [Crossiella sp. CA-258035]